ncbi:hypothetical protein FRC17_006023 [Serendipita sp. 399]|nr:hypothetical protein FRC17_006023 [Serendipita sp. 399]
MEFGMPIAIYTTTVFDPSVRIFLLPAFMAFLTLTFHGIVLNRWRETAFHRALISSPQVIHSITLVVFNILFGFVWLVISIVVTIFVSTLPTERNPSPVARSDPLYHGLYRTPVLLWLPGLTGFIISILLWIYSCMAYCSRQEFFKFPPEGLLGPAPGTNRLFSDPHTKWIVGLIVLGTLLGFTNFAFSFTDGTYGGYSLWTIPSVALLTLLLHLITIIQWTRTIENRRGTHTPPSIYSISLILILSLLAVLWCGSAIVAYLIQTHKVDNEKLIQWSFKYQRFDLFIFTRWIATGLAAFMAILTLAELALIVVNRHKFLQRVRLITTSHALSTLQPSTGMNPTSGNSGNSSVAGAGANGARETSSAHPEVQSQPPVYKPVNPSSYLPFQYS